MDQLPYRFIPTAAYPAPSTVVEEGWRVRVTIETARTANAGTDADITLGVDGLGPTVLDHGPLVGVGAESIRASGRCEACSTACSDTTTSRRSTHQLRAAGQPGRAADHPDTSQRRTLGRRPVGRVLAQRRHQGRYDIHGTLRRTGATGTDPRRLRTEQWEVGFTRLVCTEESDWDRGSRSDEPFVVGTVIVPGMPPVTPLLVGPFSDVASGDERAMSETRLIDVPVDIGVVMLAVEVWESDSESREDREDIRDRFAGRVETATADADDGFLVTLGEMITSDWEPARVEVCVFRRGPYPTVVDYRPETIGRVLGGGDRHTWTLAETGRRSVTLSDDLGFGCILPEPPLI